MHRDSQKQLTFLADKLPATHETCPALARCFSPAPCSRVPSPAQSLPAVPHHLRSRAWEAGPRPPATALCGVPGSSGSPTAALGMLRGGRGGRFASQALALGGRRARGCSWSSGARSWSCRSFPPTPPSSRAAAGAGAEAARGGQPAPDPAESCPEPEAPRGAAPGEEPRWLGRVPRTGTVWARAGLNGRARVWGAGGRGRGQARGMRLQPPQRLGLPALSPMREAGSGTPLRSRRGRQSPDRCF